MPVGEGPDDRWHREAFKGQPSGTYELLGPKVQGNKYNMKEHILARHGEISMSVAPTEFEVLKEFLFKTDIEGIVWHHTDGRMVKIKAKDFGIKRCA